MVGGPSAADVTAPVTTAQISGTAGQNSWYTSDVSVALSAEDIESGVDKIEYSLDGGTTWIVYSGAIAITSEGTSTINYHSTDIAENVEEIKNITINIDKTAPVITAQISNASVALSAADTVSGLNKIEYSLDGTNWLTYTAPIVLAGGGGYTLRCRSEDIAANIIQISLQVGL
jgi:hypothetical protein